jgi:hypothetical protein
MTTALSSLLHRRDARVQVNFTSEEAEQLELLATAAGARTRASMARALVIDGIRRHAIQPEA